MLNTTLGTPQRHHSLTLFPLLASGAAELPYQLLTDALHAATLRITEVGSGTVPTLLAVNDGSADVLILDGEQLIGARQNRMTNRTLLLPAGSKTEIPVSCMEQGRWHAVGEEFAPSKQHSPSTVRRRAREVEARHAASGAPASADVLSEAQGQVWDAIASQAADLGAAPPSGALDDLFSVREEEIEAGIRALPHQELQVGSLVFIGTTPLGMDLIGAPALYARLHERLIRGYLLDALSRPSADALVESASAQGFLDQVRDAARVSAPSVGKGSYAILSQTVVGGELTDAGAIIHLSAFPPVDDRGRRSSTEGVPPSPIAPPSRRRRS